MSPDVVPYADSHSLSVGGNLSSAEYNFDLDGFDVLVKNDYNDNGVRARASGVLVFSVDEQVGYALAGAYAAQRLGGAANQFGRVFLRVQLRDRSSGEDLFFDVQSTTGVDAATLVLGDSDDAFGSRVGSLVPGHSYELAYEAFILSFNSGSLPRATSEGMITLALVPEPPPLALLILCLLVLSIRCSLDVIPKQEKAGARG